MRISPASASKRHGWMLPPEGAQRAASTMISMGSAPSGSGWSDRCDRRFHSRHVVVHGSTGAHAGQGTSSTSKRTRPEGSSPAKPIRRTAAAAVAAPSVTSLPSCGQPVIAPAAAQRARPPRGTTRRPHPGGAARTAPSAASDNPASSEECVEPAAGRGRAAGPARGRSARRRGCPGRWSPSGPGSGARGPPPGPAASRRVSRTPR